MLGCLFGISLLAGLWAAYYMWLSPAFESPGVWIGSGLAGFLSFLCVGALLNARNAWRERRLIALAQRDAPLFDGQFVAALGKLECERDPVIASTLR